MVIDQRSMQDVTSAKPLMPSVEMADGEFRNDYGVLQNTSKWLFFHMKVSAVKSNRPMLFQSFPAMVNNFIQHFCSMVIGRATIVLCKRMGYLHPILYRKKFVQFKTLKTHIKTLNDLANTLLSKRCLTFWNRSYYLKDWSPLPTIGKSPLLSASHHHWRFRT